MKEINECIGDIGHAGSSIFTTLDLTSGFRQIPMHQKDAHLTALNISGKSQFEWITSPMGLHGCPAYFQCLIEKAMEGIASYIVYSNNLLIHTDTLDKHIVELDKVMERLVTNGLKINLDKCVFGN